MEKLQLKHLVPYLPYKLNYFIDGEEYACEMEGIYEHEDVYNSTHGDTPISNIYPILRPLSDLTKEIEVNGEKFVPIEYNAFKHSKNDIIEFQNKFIHYKGMKFGIIERFLEWHFDVFGLIDAGLAIDINTI